MRDESTGLRGHRDNILGQDRRHGRNAVDQRSAIAVEIQDERVSVPWRKMPGDEHLAVIRREAQIFDAAQSRTKPKTRTPVRIKGGRAMTLALSEGSSCIEWLRCLGCL